MLKRFDQPADQGALRLDSRGEVIMRSGRLRQFLASICVALIVVTSIAPTALAEVYEDPAQDGSSNPAFDLLILRPIGIIGAGIGTLLFLVPVAPLTLITRPQDIGKPFDKLVVQPVRYVVADPLGQH